jgi:predicted nucleic acid-binding protein
MIVVDSSVWIDYFRGRQSVQTTYLDAAFGRTPVMAGDLIVAEVLQGFNDDRSFRLAEARFLLAEPLVISDHRVAVQAARNYRHLRGIGITIRKTIDTLIATRCILDRLPLLYSDRDFDPFVQHLGLRPALATPE